jgi:RHS repeat-associated protein
VNASSHNNGNVIQIANNKDTTRTQQFTYDSLNRIITAKTTSTTGANCWGQNFGYDQWANLTSTTVSQCTAPGLSMAMSANSNQFTTTGFSYDASGNVLADGTNTYAWNAESEIKTAPGVNYTYDGDGDRVQKSNGKIYWYGAGSEILDESDSSGSLTDEYIFFGGKRIARRDSSNNVVYYAADHLGTSRVVASSAGAILDQSDFYPFGGERVLSASSGNTYKFTSKERDTESNLDNFGARYDSSILGRFMSPDWSAQAESIPYADLENPQSLNLYAYVGNNPLGGTDPDGHCDWCQKLANWLGGDGWYTDAQIVDQHRTWLLQHASSDADIEKIKNATPELVNNTYACLHSDSCTQHMQDYIAAINSAAQAAAAAVKFGGNASQDYHTFRHVEDAGIDKQAAEKAIRQDLAGRESSLPQGLTKGHVTVGGKTLEYNAYKLPDGTINVGRITVH